MQFATFATEYQERNWKKWSNWSTQQSGLEFQIQYLIRLTKLNLAIYEIDFMKHFIVLGSGRPSAGRA